METCRLWVTLGSGRRHRGEPNPTTFLRFARTGLLVGLPDEPGGQLMDRGPLKAFPMRRADAEGLGLTADDFAEGVTICREDSGHGEPGWSCERVQLLIGAEERIDALAPRATPAATRSPGAGAVPAAAGMPAMPAVLARPLPPAPPARPRRILAVVDAEAADHSAVDEAAALARRHGAALLLVATGELAETARHAAEERASLTRRLEELAAPLADLSVRTVVDMSGDPVRGILGIADAAAVDLILAPTSHSRFADAVEPRMAAALARRARVPVRTADAPPPADAGVTAPERALAQELRVVIAGVPHAGASAAWAAAAEAAVLPVLGDVAFAGAHLAVDARWYARARSAVDHFALATVMDTVMTRHAGRDGMPSAILRLASEVIAVGEPADERLELHIRAA